MLQAREPSSPGITRLQLINKEQTSIALQQNV